QMIGARRIDQEARGVGVRDAGIRNDGASRGTTTTWSSTNRGGVSTPRNVETGSRAGNGSVYRGESGRSFGGSQSHGAPHGGGETPRAATASSAPRGGRGSHVAPAPAHASGGGSSSNAASSSSSSSSSSKKP